MLLDKKCFPCSAVTPPLTPEQVKECVYQVDAAWQVLEGIKIRRKFLFADFKSAIAFVNKVAEIAEAEIIR